MIQSALAVVVSVVLVGMGAMGCSAVKLRTQQMPIPRRPVSTYSVVARDPATGNFGVAVQSHWFSVGSVVPWAEAGVGAVATQSLVNVTYGPLGLELMRGGRTAPEALKALIETDDGADVRQVAMIDAHGNVATHTGKHCIAMASDHNGTTSDGMVYSCQSNLMLKGTVADAMARALETSSGKPFADRLIDALRAAQGEGGDIRGRQSAAIVIVKGESSGRPWDDEVVRLHVHDHPTPLVELQRLLTLHNAYEHMNEGDLAIEHKDTPRALREYGAAMKMAPEVHEMVFWTAVSLVSAGEVDKAIPLLARAYTDPNADWRETLRRLPASELLPDDPKLIERLATIPAER